MRSGMPNAVNPVNIVIKECIKLSNAIHKYTNKYNQSGVSVILGGGSEIFSDQIDSGNNDPFSYLSSSINTDSGNPILLGLYQLRIQLKTVSSIEKLDPSVILEPFLLIISTSSIPGYVTSLALDSLQKFFHLGIAFNGYSKRHMVAYRETVKMLTLCRFESSNLIPDDAVLLKVVYLLQLIVDSPFGDILSDAIVYEVLQVIMSLACNGKRTAVLRKAAETAMLVVTIRIFSKLKDIAATAYTHVYINDEVYAQDELKGDTIGATAKNEVVDEQSLSENEDHEESGRSGYEKRIKNDDDITDEKDEEDEQNYGLPVIKDYLNLLLSLVIPEKQVGHSEATTVFSLNLLKVAIEISGDKFLLHPRLFTYISDPIFESVLFLIQNSDDLPILEGTLELFTTIVLILGNSLQMQIELTFNCLLNILFNEINQKQNSDGKGKSLQVKKLIVEQISTLWICSPSFFVSLFMDYDCILDRMDISLNLLKALTSLSLPETATKISANVPSLCLEGLILFVDDVYGNLQGLDKDEYLKNSNQVELLKQREHKTSFIDCAESFNKKPKHGINLLIERGFIQSNSNEHIAKFLFENNSRMNKRNIGLILCDPDRTSLLQSFIDLYDFTDLRVDEAIRILLTKFRLPGESQQIERIIESFSNKFVSDQNYESKESEEKGGPLVQPDSDSVFVLSYSVIMLNTDLHNPQVKENMSFEDYSSNLGGCNNSGDFPYWYLDKIYCSIRDKEIIMPEEHHGNKKWFEDAWDNLLSSVTVITEGTLKSTSIFDNQNAAEIAQFDRAIFESMGPLLVKAFLKIFMETTDTHISSIMLNCIEKCSYIASFFEFPDIYNDILDSLSKKTSILGIEWIEDNKQLAEIEDMPLVDIFVESTNSTIPVSKTSMRLGKFFKGQLSLVVLFQIIKNNKGSNMISPEVWSQIIKIILVLYENKLITPDLFTDLQEKLNIGQLPKPNPDVKINKVRINKGLLSTFASYLKGDDEPSDSEVEVSLKALECVQSVNLTLSIFSNESYFTPTIIRLFLNSIQVEKTEENSRFFEPKILFLIEISVALYLFCKEENALGNDIVNCISKLSEVDGISRQGIRRLTSYQLLLLSVLDENGKLLKKIINDEILTKNEIFKPSFFASDQGLGLINQLFALTEIYNYKELVSNDDGFWKLLRNIVVNTKNTSRVYLFIENFLKNKKNLINSHNFTLMLGLLDEISSVGAVGNQWEKDYNSMTNAGKTVSKESPYQAIVDVSLKSINLTSNLLQEKDSIKFITNKELLAVVQTLAHQYLNPCRQLRFYALNSLETSLSNPKLIKSLDNDIVDEIINDSLLPILESDEKNNDDIKSRIEVASIIFKICKSYHSEGKVSKDTYDNIVKLTKIHEVKEDAEEIAESIEAEQSN